MDKALLQKFPFILDRNLAKANCTVNRVCTSCDTVVLDLHINLNKLNIKYQFLVKKINGFEQKIYMFHSPIIYIYIYISLYIIYKLDQLVNSTLNS